MVATTTDLHFTIDEQTGAIASVQLFGVELLHREAPVAEVRVNGQALATRLYQPAGAKSLEHSVRLKGELFVNHLTGAALVVTREMGRRPATSHRCMGIQYWVRREWADLSYPIPGPGSQALECPLWLDTLSLLNLNWQFWGDDTRMIYPNAFSAGPSDEWGHIGCEHDTPEACKRYLENFYRRIYPGGLVLNGGVFYNATTEHWIAITCRRPHTGYLVNISDAGRGVSYDFKLHAHFGLAEQLRLPEIVIYYGETREEMLRWMADYATFHYPEPPDWTYKTLWGQGIAWNNQPTWRAQAEHWERELDKGQYNGIWINLVTNRPMWSGTSPTGYEPDPNHGSIEEFRRMCRRIADRGVPMITWMSHSGLLPGAPDVDDDWFIRGIDGKMVPSWGNIDSGMMYINPGHPGYIEYTKKWVRFYLQECGVRGIFFDCLGFPIPPDFVPRLFMRFPADTAVMAIRFMEEMYRFIKECNPEAIMVGEGASLDGPVEMFSVITNPRRAIDGLGPRDFLLQLNRHTEKKLTIYHDLPLFPASGFCCAAGPGWEQHNRYMIDLLQARGGRGVFTPLPGDLSVLDDLLFVPIDHALPNGLHPAITLPAPWNAARALVEEITGARVTAVAEGTFRDVRPGVYRMQ